MDNSIKYEILKARADQNYRQKSTDQIVEIDGWLDYLSFEINHNRYAINLNYITSTFQIEDITPIPGLPPFFKGLINNRGSIIPIMDIRYITEKKVMGLSDNLKAIIIEYNNKKSAIAVTRVSDIIHINSKQITISESITNNFDVDIFSGVVDHNTLIIDPIKVFNANELIIYQQ